MEPGEGACASFDYSGRIYAVATPNRGVALYDVSNFKNAPFDVSKLELLQHTVAPTPTPNAPAPPPPYPSRVSWSAIEFSPDEKFIALSTTDRGVLIVDSFTSSREYALLNKHPISVDAAKDGVQANGSPISWSPCGRFLAVGGADGHVYTYDMDSSRVFTGARDVPGQFLKLASEDLSVQSVPQPYTPGLWDPPVRMLGEAHKTEAARQAAYIGAASYREGVWNQMRILNSQRAAQAALQGIPPAMVQPVVPTGLPVPLAGSPEEQVSRLEGPVRCVRFHPKSALLASASSSVALWTSPGP